MGNINRFYADIMALHKEVTGSCILINVKFPNDTSKKILMDCGLFQELDYSELNKTLPFNPKEIDYVFVTHNHVDHTGRLPLLVKLGYRGNIYVSKSTSKLISNALEDSYKVLKNKAELNNQSLLYSSDDVEETLKLIKPINFEETIQLNENLKFTFFMNGHLPGAVVTLLNFSYTDFTNKTYDDINILNTGDYNNKNMFFDVKPISSWVYDLPITIIQESTYGNMNSSEINYVFKDNLLNALKQNKEVVVPVFSLGRSQEIMYVLKIWQDEGILDKSIPIYFDGKLGVRYTNIYLKDGLDNKPECKDFLPENFTIVTDCEIRKSIIQDNASKIILTTSGMGSHGPAQTYLPAYITRKNALIHFTGYVAEGTLGRRLYECNTEDTVDMFGLKKKKLADVQFTNEFSAHAKGDELLDFLRPFKNIKFLLINHGSNDKKEFYENRVINELNPKDVGILGRDYFFRVNSYGFVKSLTTKFV